MNCYTKIYELLYENLGKNHLNFLKLGFANRTIDFNELCWF